jgi:hypothetical protein
MVTAEITLPDGRRARLTGPSREAVIQQAQRLAGMGTDPNTGAYDESLAKFDSHIRGLTQETAPRDPRARVTLPLGLGSFNVRGGAAELVNAVGNVDDKTSTPVVLGSLGALATGGTSLVPSVLGAGLGGGAGGGLAESRDRNATPGSIARAALRDAATMAGSELAGFGLGAAANRLIAPNLATYVDPMKPVRERVAATGLPQYLRGAASRLATRLPRPLQRAGQFAGSSIGGELLEAAAVPAMTAAFGPAAGAAAYLGRAAFAPGVLQRYLSRSTLPNELARIFGRRALTAGIGGVVIDQSREDER